MDINFRFSSFELGGSDFCWGGWFNGDWWGSGCDGGDYFE